MMVFLKKPKPKKPRLAFLKNGFCNPGCAVFLYVQAVSEFTMSWPPSGGAGQYQYPASGSLDPNAAIYQQFQLQPRPPAAASGGMVPPPPHSQVPQFSGVSTGFPPAATSNSLFASHAGFATG